jgi:UDP-glucose-4-epimerase GalE
MKSILVVGGAGYIGAHTCKALKAAGYNAVSFDNLTTGHRNFVKWGPLVVGDILDTLALEQVLRDFSIDAVIHFAAHAYIGESVFHPQKYYINNVSGTLSLLQAMRNSGVDKIVFSSTCAVYGQPPQLPVLEGMPTIPITPYGHSKLMVEQILSDYRSAYSTKYVALRYFNASGADVDCELGELRDPETHLIPRAMMYLQGHLDSFEVFGTDYPTHDGTAIRDYVHVADLADAHVLATDHLLSSGEGGVFNLGSGAGYSVKQVLDAISRETRLSLPAPMGRRRKGDAAQLYADASLVAKTLGWRPRSSSLDEIVRTAWQWHKKAHPKQTPADR